MKKIILSLSLALLSLAAWADSFTVGGVKYDVLSEDDLTVSITGYTSDFAGVLKGTVDYNDKTYKVAQINKNAFQGCTALTDIDDLPYCTKIGELIYGKGGSAFNGCTALTSVGNLPNCTLIGAAAFSNCTALTSIGDLSNCTSIGENAFSSCTSLTSVGDLPNCTNIGKQAFNGCTALTSIGNLSNCTSIGSLAFNGCFALKEVVLKQKDVTIDGAPTGVVFRVPQEYLESYRAADGWKEIQAHIIPIEATTDYTLTTSARESTSDILAQIGEDAMLNVMSLKVSGTINSYDIMMMRNKMVNLRDLDLSGASIVANPYEYYTGYHSEDSILGPRSFYDCQYLRSVVLPGSIKEIGDGAFENSNLTSITFAEGLRKIGVEAFGSTNIQRIVLPKGLKTIGTRAFLSCSMLTDVTFPERLETIEERAFYSTGLTTLDIPSGLKTIGYNAFNSCNALTSVSLSNGLTTIENNAFQSCTALTSVKLPVTLITIGSDAFSGCTALKDFKIPSSITSIGDGAFSGCTALNDIYTWTVEPISIGQNTFSTVETATIHTPTASHDNYYYDTQWSQFLKQVDFDEPYEYFYINNDYTLDEDHNGRIDGTPDADLNEGSGLIVEGKTDQNIDSLNVKDDGEGKGASVIGDGNIEAGKLVFNIKIYAGRWHFFCFPFDIKLSDIVPPGSNWVFRYYDGAERARSGKGGWKDLPDDDKEWLHAGRGYIFQCSVDGTLKINVQKEKFGKFEKRDVSHEMDTYTAGNAQDASWNFMGNPFLSYYDMDDLFNSGYDAPITRWNGSGYEAVRPGDDDYCFHPFEAFFVQKPENIGSMDFMGDKRTTYQLNEQKKETAKSKGLVREVSTDRMLVNLELTDGKATDKTRVVLNEKKSEDYEIGCDAAKFLTTGRPQLYSTDAKAVRYAINERPAGDIRLGYVAPRNGEYTITAPRMDCPMMLIDQLRGTTFDLTLGGYTFQSEAGTNDTRFLLVKNTQVEGVSSLKEETGVSVLPTDGGLSIKGAEREDVAVYNTAGMLVNRTGNGFIALQSGIYIVKVGNASAKVYIK